MTDLKSELCMAAGDLVGPIPVQIGGRDSMTVDTSGPEIVEITALVMSSDCKPETRVVRYLKVSVA